MTLRALLVALLVASTVAFVVGVSIERSSADNHGEPAAHAEAGEATEGADEHAGETGVGEARHAEPPSAETEQDEDETLFGVDLEATPFVVLAAAFSLALALGVWLRARWALLAVAAVAMVPFAALDVRELLHQIDESDAGLAVMAGTVAALHLAAAAIATRLAAQALQEA
jgi:hypothetical protein